MDTIVNKLLDVDREARQMLDEARQYAERTALEIEEEKEKIRREYDGKAEGHIVELEAEQAGEADEVKAREEERMNRLLSGLEERFRENRDAWAEELARRCVEAPPG